MKSISEMSGEELLAEFRHYLGRAEPMKDWQAAEHAHFVAVRDEIENRLRATDAATEAARAKLIDRFAHAATTAVVGLWMAHGGRPFEGTESDQFAKLMFEFFKEIR